MPQNWPFGHRSLQGGSVLPKDLVYQARNGWRLALAAPRQVLTAPDLFVPLLEDCLCLARPQQSRQPDRHYALTPGQCMRKQSRGFGAIDTNHISVTLGPIQGNDFNRKSVSNDKKSGQGGIAMHRGIKS
jgi:hypothetical protein